MAEPVSIPYWALLLLILFAAVGLYDRIFGPTVRWFFRGRINRAIDELNQRLHLRIQPFKLTHRQTLIDQLMYDRKVLEAVEAEASAQGVPRAVMMKRAERYAREIVPSFSAFAYFGFGTRAARWLSQALYRVRLGYADGETLQKVDPNSTVVFVMNHRSNMDYVLVTYMASSQASLSYAVGEWARIWVLESLIRSMGAYFIRRNSNDPLYRRVLGRYVAMATRQGVTQAVFPEGGLSRDGRLGQPKLGILSYIVTEFDASADRDIVFIPVGINYDRVLEDRVLTAKAEREITGRDFRTSLGSIAGFMGNMAKLRLTGRMYRFGYACVSFGKPVSLREWQKARNVDLRTMPPEERFEAVSRLGADLIKAVGAIVPALPVALAARVFLESPDRKFSEFEVKSGIADLIEKLAARGVHVHIPRSDQDYAAGTGLRMLTLRRLVEMDAEELYRANPQESVLLRYYANSIAHHLPGLA
jgi:glycerol-3-phosphate O-acyltransferase